MFKRIDHVAFAIKDRGVSVRFYRDHFGFQQYFEDDVPVAEIEKIAYLKLGDTVLELIEIHGTPQNQGYHFCLTTDDFAADYDRLVQAGVPVATPPHPTNPRVPEEAGWQRAVFTGPDGEAIEIRG